MTRRHSLRSVLFVLAGLLTIAGLIALGTWQVHRRTWKLDLITRVEARLRAAPVPAPRVADKGDEYRRVVARGDYLPGKNTLVQASTVRGPGWWVLTPLATSRGVILVNRGYVPDRAAPPAPTGPVTVTGLLRLSEPGGGFLRSNDPAGGRWYSRDVAAIARTDGLRTVPYFIDAAAAPTERPAQPVGGMTVVAFRNNHLVYAITWYSLALMTAVALAYFMIAPRQGRSRSRSRSRGVDAS